MDRYYAGTVISSTAEIDGGSVELCVAEYLKSIYEIG